MKHAYFKKFSRTFIKFFQFISFSLLFPPEKATLFDTRYTHVNHGYYLLHRHFDFAFGRRCIQL